MVDFAELLEKECANFFFQAIGNSFINWEPVRQPFTIDSNAAKLIELAIMAFESCSLQLSSLALNVT